MDKKTSVAYLPEYKVSIPAEENETADMLNYKYNVTLGGKKRSNFIGMQEYQEPTLEDVKSVVFNAEPKQKEESSETEYKKKTLDELGMEKLAKQPIQYKEKGDTDYVAPFFKSAVGGTIDFFGNIISGAYLTGQDIGAGFAGLDVGEKINIDPEIAESARRLKQSQANVRKVLGLEIDEDDSQLASDIGGLVSSLFNSFAVAGLTKSTYAVASLFGLSSGGETYLNLREQGIGVLEALRTSSSVGFTEGALEKFGLDRLFESYVFKLGKNIGLKTVGKQTLVDVIQESSQSLSRNFLMAPYEEGYQFNRWIKEALYEGMLGGLISPVSGGAVYLTTKQLREKHSKVFQDKMGLSKEQADQLAVQAVLAPEDAKANILEIMNNEVLANEENQTLVEDAEQTVQQGKDLLDKLLEQKALGLSDESQAIVDENAQKIKERAIAEGLSAEEAEDAAKLSGSLLKNAISLGVESGMTEEQIAEEFNFDITNAEDTIEKVAYVDENGRYVGEEEISIEDERKAIQEAYREEEVASLMASGMSEDEARFRVETGREPTDFDRAIGFNYIPYQTQEFTEEETQAMGIMNNPDREQIVANMSEEEKKNFNALEQSVKNKELYNQSVDLQKEMNDIDRAEFDAGVPMWDKDTININGVERAVTNSSGKKIAHSEKSLRMFYEWFGDSKVVDAEGRPLIVYHGTRQPNIREFKAKYDDKLIFFAYEKEFADNWATHAPLTPEQEEEYHNLYRDEDYENFRKDLNRKIKEKYGEDWDKSGDSELIDKILKEYSEAKKEFINNKLGIKETTMPVYLKAESTFIPSEHWELVIDEIEKYYDKDFRDENADDQTKSYMNQIKNGKWIFFEHKNVMDKIRKLGFDSIQLEEISGGGITTIAVFEGNNQIKSTSNTGTFSKSNDDIRYQFGGPSAVTAALDKLEQAKKAEEYGYSAEEIWKLTGWMRGADKKWRFEISDKDATIDKRTFNILKDTDKEYNFVIGDLLKHEKLYEAYPEFEYINIVVDPSLKGTGTKASLRSVSYGDDNPANLWHKIAISPDAFSLPESEVKSILLHEVQHAIQRRESFASGGNPRFFIENKEAFKQAFKDMASKKYKKALYDELYSKVDETLGDEILKADEESLKASKQWMKFVLDNNGDETSSEALKLEEEYDNARENLVRALEKANLTKDDFAEIKKKARDTAGMDAFQRVRDVEHYDEYDLYKRLYGEIEARNTQTRMDMSEEERLDALPESTQDYSNNEAIVVFDDGTVASFETENKEDNAGVDLTKFYQDLDKVIEAAKSSKGKGTTDNIEAKFAISQRIINILKRHNIDVNGYTSDVSASFVNHAINQHGNDTKEEKQGQIAVDYDDFAKIPSVINAPDYIVIEEYEDNSKALVFVKNMKDNTPFIVEIPSRKNRRILAKTMYKKRRAIHASELHSLNLTSKNVPVNKVIIDVNSKNVNSPRYQTEAEEKNLVVYHKISKDSLNKAIDLGGMPVPSLAIVKKDTDFVGFGGITLVGNKDMVNPQNAKNKVYNRDVWSITFPEDEYKKVTQKAKDTFTKKFGKFFDETDSKNSLSSLLYTAERAYPGSAINEFQASNGAKLAYIRTVLNKEVDIPMVDESSKILNNTLSVEADDKFIKEISQIDLNFSFNEDKDKIAASIKGLLDRSDFSKAGKHADKLKEVVFSEFFDENGNLYFAPADRAVKAVHRYLKEKGVLKVDTYALRERLDNEIKNDEAYWSWARKQVQDFLIGEPFVKVGGKLLPRTLENITKAMTSNVIVNGQKSLVYGAGKVIAAGAKELKSIEEIKAEGKKLKSFEQSEEDVKQVYDDMTIFTNSFAVSDDFTSAMDQKEAAYMALGRTAEKKNPKPSDLINSLDYELGSKGEYSQEQIDAGMNIVNSIKNLSRYYFEAKPQRAVGLQEFSAAIIPTDSSYDEIAQKVQDNGLKVIRSDNQVEAVNELNKEREVFFQIQEYDDLKSTKSVSDIKKLLKGLSPDEEVRLMYDKNKRYWFAIDAQNYIHQDMITKAFEQGLYPEFRRSYEAQQYFDENYMAEDEYLIRFKAHNFIDENDLQKLLDENIPYDEYKYGYAVKNNDGSGYVLFARSLYDLADTPLKSIGRDAEIWERNPYNMTEFSKVSGQELERNGIRYMAESGGRKPIKPYKRNPLKVLGQYEPTKKMITLFKGRNPTTLIHEMGHHYLPIQLRLLEKAGKWDKLKPLYKELGISSVEQMGRDAEEKLIDMFTSYIFYNEAPNVETQSIFERAKQWMISAYNTVKNFVKPSEEVTKFFDELIAGEENAPDISHLVGKEAELSKILQGARHGQELTINGLSMKDIAILRQALHARVPRRGRSLADVIRKAGGIDSRSEIAKALGYDSRKGGEMGFWNYRGTIDNEQALIELLVAEGFLFDVEQDSAEGVQAVWNKVEQLINNRDTTFSEAEQMQNEKREQAYKVQEMVNNILVKHYNKDIKTLEEDMKAVTKKLADIGAVAVDKATLEYLQNSLEKMSKDYRKLLSEKKEKQYKYQEELTKFIKSSPLNNKDKLKLIDKIRMVKDERTFEKYLGEVKSQIEKYVEAESKRVLDELIQKEIKSSKPRKVMAQLYDYANNKLFADLREWNKLNQTEAEIKADQLDEAIAKGNGELSRTDKLRRMFLEYKTFGKDCSVEFMQALHDEIKAAKQAGIDAKDDLDFKRAFEREQDREDILEKIKESNFDKNSFIGKVVNAYRNGISNLYSMLNSLVGKEIAEKFQFETIVENKQVKEWKHLKEVNQKAQKIYGVKSYGELLNLMADKGKKMFTIYKKKDTESFEGSLSDDFYHELSVLDLIDIYNSMKNIKTSDDYAKAYGIEQINALLANLTEQDKAFADMLMEDVNSRYKAINKVYINLYGMDLKRVDNYWMSSTEHSTPIDVLNDMRMQSTTPGFFKERTSGSVIPLPKNAWLKYQNHIAQGYYMTEVAEKFKEMAEVFKSKRIENMITNKFGEKVYKTLIDQIEAIGLNASPASVDDMSKWYNKLVSNWVGAKIALNPVVFVGQLTSFTNYAVDVPTKAYLKNFMYALRHPKEVFDFMMKHNKDFLMHRYESGFNEAMSRFITQAESLNSMKFGLSPKSKFSWANILSSLVRMGDMGSLIFGGYGQFKTMLDNGMSVEEAKKKFEFATLRSQQSGNAASIAKIQRVPNGLSMLFLPFKNTAMQYGRKIVDTVVSYQNGDITKAQATKTLTNYLFIQPALWVFIRNIAKDILGLEDEDDEYTDGILEQILVNPIEMIPFAGESFKAAYSIIADEKLYGVYSMPLFDDIEKSWKKLAKEEKDIFDWVDIISPVVEGLTATPIQTPKRYAQKWFGEE